jgi:hypothetical protein
MAAAIAGKHLNHSGQLSQSRFEAPETAATEGGDFRFNTHLAHTLRCFWNSHSIHLLLARSKLFHKIFLLEA